MIIISNKQRDDIVRYIDLLCECLQDKQSNREHNIKRLGLKLKRVLVKKQPLSVEELRSIQKDYSR